MGNAIAGASSVEEAHRLLDEWRETHAADPSLRSLLWQPMLMGELGGRLFVWDIEVGEQLRELQAQAPSTFLNMPWSEAVEYILERGLMDREGIADLVSVYQDRGVEAAEKTLRVMQERTEAALARAVEQGLTASEFALEVQNGRAELGFEAASHGYLDNVFRSTVQASYGKGRYEALQQAKDMGVIAYVQRRAVGDANTRQSHIELDGKVWAVDDPEWQRFSPPLLDGVFQYQCRCTSVSVREGAFDEADLQRSAAAVVEAHPEEFEGKDRVSDPMAMMTGRIE